MLMFCVYMFVLRDKDLKKYESIQGLTCKIYYITNMYRIMISTSSGRTFPFTVVVRKHFLGKLYI